MRKFYHVVLKKNDNFYYEIFEIITINAEHKQAVLFISENHSFEKEKKIFDFKSFNDLSSLHPKNEYFKNYFGEDRMFFLCAKEAIDTIRQLYKGLAEARIKYTLQQHDKMYHEE